MPFQKPPDNTSSSSSCSPYSSPNKLESTHSDGQFPLSLPFESLLCSANPVPIDDKNGSSSVSSLITQPLNAGGPPRRSVPAFNADATSRQPMQTGFTIFARTRRPELSATKTMGVGEIRSVIRREWNAMDTVSHISLILTRPRSEVAYDGLMVMLPPTMHSPKGSPIWIKPSVAEALPTLRQ